MPSPLIPLVMIVAAAFIGLCYAKFASRRFDRSHPDLSREGLRAAERAQNRDGDGI